MRCLALLLILALAACAGPAAPPLRQEASVDGITIALETADGARINTAVDFVVTLTDAQGRLISDASVYLDMDMPAMPMGETRPVAVPDGPGRYLARTAYTMSGRWEITVVVERAGATYRATFSRDAAE